VTDIDSNTRSANGAAPTSRRVNRWAGRIRAFVTAVGVGNLLVAVVAGVVGASLVTEPENGGGVAAAIAVQAVTLPVLLARVAPAWAAGAQAAGVLLNEVAIGPMVRCGVIFPVMFVIVYQLGAADPEKHRMSRWLGIGACVATTAMELAFDPVLDSSSAIFVASLGLGFYCAGMVIRSRTRLVATLLRRTNELHEQRDRTAALEVAADRARVGADLERLIRAQIQAIGASAEQAQAAANDDTDRAQSALIEVENSGRETLARMRDVVGTLRDAPTEPPPGLDQLADLLRRATCSDARLTIHGVVRPLTTNVELSAYRIVEQLLTTLRDHPTARVEVNIHFTEGALKIRVSGPTRQDDSPGVVTELRSALHAVRARAEMHGGTVMTRNPVGRRETEVRLPLLTAAPS